MARKILLADDSITIQKVVELTFSDGDYEVTAVNNGARAIQKLSDMRPDIILSDIIMPEKNGYEVCEYVKSHPDYRTIPVILLTGTFEPFDPDRADQAGCDAVVTKPFESQSLIHKVDELITQAEANAAAAAPPPPPEPEPAPSPWAMPEEHGSDIFAAPQGEAAETRAFPMMHFDELQRTGETPMPPADNPWDDTAETPAPPPPAPAAAMPWDEPTAERPAFAEHPAESTSPWDEPAPPSFEAETRAFPKMSFEELSSMPTHEEPAPPPPTPEQQEEQLPPQFEPSPWDEPGAWAPASEVPVIDEPLPAESFSTAAVAPFEESLAAPPSAPAEEETPFGLEEPPPIPAEEPLWAPHEGAPVAAPAPEPPPPVEPEPQPVFEAPPAAEEPAPAAASAVVSSDLTDEQVDRIARRVVQLMSEQVVKNIAWEVIPDMAEMVVKQRIRELEAEA